MRVYVYVYVCVWIYILNIDKCNFQKLINTHFLLYIYTVNKKIQLLSDSVIFNS